MWKIERYHFITETRNSKKSKSGLLKKLFLTKNVFFFFFSPHFFLWIKILVLAEKNDKNLGKKN